VKPVAAIVQSAFDFAVREINALEQRIVSHENDADALLWEQARQVVAQLEAGMSQRQLAAQWINVRTGEPYSVAHVSYIAKVYRVKFTEQPRPRFRDVYNTIANGSNQIHRLLNQSGDVEWYTPPHIVDAVRDVLGGIDLDPASCAPANTVVQASQIYTAEDNGLEQPWRGRVFMNPPYGQPAVRYFCEKFAQHVTAGEITHGIVLINNTSDTAAFRALAAIGTAFCFPASRLAFWKADRDTGSANQPQVLVYAGPDRAAFCRRFRDLGLVLVPPDTLSGSLSGPSGAPRRTTGRTTPL
jgi:hypothetical protein